MDNEIMSLRRKLDSRERPVFLCIRFFAIPHDAAEKIRRRSAHQLQDYPVRRWSRSCRFGAALGVDLPAIATRCDGLRQPCAVILGT